MIRVKAKTEELLYLVLWACETLSRPTWRNLTESFEGWAYRRGLLRQLQRLEKQQLLERQADPRDRLHRLTEAGRLQALGGRDPEASWKRHWDGRWRLVLFDVPEARSSARNKLRRYLQSLNLRQLVKQHPRAESDRSKKSGSLFSFYGFRRATPSRCEFATLEELFFFVFIVHTQPLLRIRIREDRRDTNPLITI